jgi:hypothetical protein
MFRFIKPPSDQYLLREGTVNVCMHYGIIDPTMYAHIVSEDTINFEIGCFTTKSLSHYKHILLTEVSFIFIVSGPLEFPR